VVVKPVQLDLLEESAAGTPMALEWATAHVFDPASGDELEDAAASVSLLVGASTTPLTWGSIVGSSSAYSVRFPNAQFAAPPPAQPTYQITTSESAGPASAQAWSLVAAPPDFVGAITLPSASTAIPVGKDLTVTWPLQAGADYELVQLFRRAEADGGGAWQQVYGSPSLDAPDINAETIPAAALSTAGTYLLNVGFAKSNCPAGGDGCVQASTVANEELVVR
jgi:hypothetical protein